VCFFIILKLFCVIILKLCFVVINEVDKLYKFDFIFVKTMFMCILKVCLI
jgi:hypothetical protein